jgi:peptidoglycan hydrolase-like protein with peptidoglycan-binding domain
MLKLKTGIPWDEEYNYETMETEYPFTQPAAVGQTQNGSYFLGASGPDIAVFQQKLKDLGYYEGPIDGVFGKEMEDALKLFQTRNGLKADGMIGKNTAAALNDPSAIKKTDLVPEYFVLSSGSASLYVKNLQTILKNHYFYHGKLDGVYGPDMVAAVRNLQAAAGLVVDGKAGEETQKVILGLNSDVLTVNGKTLTYPIRTLKRGMWGWDVYMLQQRLIAGNYLTGIYTKGEFDAATQKAVILAEKTFMITQDGIFGSQLRRYLWSTNVADDNDEASKYADWDQNGNFIGKTLRKGASGDAVRYVQMKLKANGFLLDDMDGIYGESTRKAVLALQKMINKQKKADGDDNYIKQDGVVGPQTWTIIRDLHQAASQDDYSLDANIDTPTEGAELVEVDPGEPAISAITRTLRQGSNGKQVKRLQQMMIQAGYLASGEDDGFYGPITKAAVLAFQQDVNSAYGSKVIKEDGVVGTQTLYHLQIKLSGQELPGKVKP